jgi:hypothetical protein
MRANDAFTFTIVGNPDDGFTSAEITSVESGDEVARVFELTSGWYIQTEAPEALRDPRLVEAVLAAQAELLHFVNRKGVEFPAGTSRAGASLILMERDDGKGFSAV